MANRTDFRGGTAHGTNPQFLFSKIVRNKIWNDRYWKETCFGLTAGSLIDVAVQCEYVGGTYGGYRKPSPFLCLVLKCCQLMPDKDVIYEYILQDDFKYLRAIGAFFLRLVGKSEEVYKYLEPLLSDFRKLRVRHEDGSYGIIYMDEFVDRLLTDRSYMDVDFPALQKRDVLEKEKKLGARETALDVENEEELLALMKEKLEKELAEEEIEEPEAKKIRQE